MATRNEIVNQAIAWIGRKESNGTFKSIIDVYNAHKPLARGYKVKYTDEWCATFVSAVSIKTKATTIIPTECSCRKMVALFQTLGSWMEADDYTPQPGDIIFYHWKDSGKGDNKSAPNHVGIVEKVSGKTITVIEGNYKQAVKRRSIKVNGKYIRGYGIPKYTELPTKTVNQLAKEVILGLWGNGSARKKALTAVGYDYKTIQKRVNELLK